MQVFNASISPDINRPEFRKVIFDDVVSGYYDQVRGLVDGGVDFLMIEIRVFADFQCQWKVTLNIIKTICELTGGPFMKEAVVVKALRSSLAVVLDLLAIKNKNVGLKCRFYHRSGLGLLSSLLSSLS